MPQRTSLAPRGNSDDPVTKQPGATLCRNPPVAKIGCTSRGVGASLASRTGTTFAMSRRMQRIAALWAEEHGNVAYGYLIVTFCMILIAGAVVGLAVPIAIENVHSERMLIENNP
jgi:hypothetical protein